MLLGPMPVRKSSRCTVGLAEHAWQPCDACRRCFLELQACAEVRRAHAELHAADGMGRLRRSSRASSPRAAHRGSVRYSFGSVPSLDFGRNGEEAEGRSRRNSCGGTGGTATHPANTNGGAPPRPALVPRTLVWDYPLSQREKAVRLMQL